MLPCSAIVTPLCLQSKIVTERTRASSCSTVGGSLYIRQLRYNMSDCSSKFIRVTLPTALLSLICQQPFQFCGRLHISLFPLSVHLSTQEHSSHIKDAVAGSERWWPGRPTPARRACRRWWRLACACSAATGSVGRQTRWSRGRRTGRCGCRRGRRGAGPRRPHGEQRRRRPDTWPPSSAAGQGAARARASMRGRLRWWAEREAGGPLRRKNSFSFYFFQ